MNKKVISFNELAKQYKNECRDAQEERKLNIEASYLFHKALKEEDNMKAYDLASNAYEIDQSKYEYKVYAISKLEDKNRRQEEYKALYEEINNLINAFTKDALLKIYDESEYDKNRYCDLEYHYATCLIECAKYSDAYKLLFRLLNSKNNYRFKVKHLLLNIKIIENDYQGILDLYDYQKDDSILILIPLSFAYLKLNKYKEFVDTIRHINYLNPNFSTFFTKEINEIDVKNAPSSYEIASTEELYNAFKYFLFIYKSDSEYLKKIKTILCD